MRSFKLKPLKVGVSKARGGKNYGRKKRSEKKKRAEKHKVERDKALDELKELNKKLKIKYKYKKDKSAKEEPWGDVLTTDDNWPNITENGTLRYFGQNVNGISYKDGYMEWLLTLQQMEEYQVDVASMVEINLDLNKPAVRKELFDMMKKYDKFAKISTTASKESYSPSPYKPGGNITMAKGNWAGRVYETGQDEMGRWTYIIMEGRNDRKIIFITFYRVCKKTSESGGCTIRLQQERDLYKYKKSQADPREVILADLEREIQKRHEEGFDVFLFGDINEEVREAKRVKEFLQNANLKNIMTAKHNDKILPHTYDRGQKCLDIMAMTASIDDKAIHKCGIIPFYEGMLSDHRAFYVDLKTDFLFTNAYVDSEKHSFKRFNTGQAKKCNKYLYTLERYLEENRIFNKVNELEKNMQEYITENRGDINQMIEECHKLFQKTTQLMLASEKKVGRAHYTNAKESSPKLTEAAKDVLEVRHLVRKETTKQQPDSDLVKKNRILLQEAKREFKLIQQHAKEHREQYLIELSTKKAKAWEVTTQQAATVISEAEVSRKMHSRHKWYMKPHQTGAIKHILVPAPKSNIIPHSEDIVNPLAQTRVNDPKDIFNVLLRQNFHQLLKSQYAITSQGELQEKIGWNAEGDFVDNLLSGLDEIETSSITEGDQILSNFIKAMKMANTEDGKQIKEFQWTYGIEEYKATFSKTRETTACGPSGLHMSHWKAALERDCIMRVHSFFIWAAFQFGFSYKRWEISWHCMLQKKQHPFSQKMRIIQLFEGDFNGALKYLMGRRLMWHITHNKVIDADTYGSRLGKTATEAILNLQLIFDYCRLQKHNLGMLFNDADGCYDRIPPALADIALRRVGCPKSITQAHTTVQRQMQHYIKTGSGVSIGHIQFAPIMKAIIAAGIIMVLSGPIGGVGQGGGGSPIIWLAVLLMLIQAYKCSNDGITIENIITLQKIQYWIISYVDDNTIVRYFTPDTSITEMLNGLRNNLMQWNALLQYTGGALSLNKCKVSVMHWKQDFFGILRLEANSDNTSIQIPSEEIGGNMDTLERLEPWECERVLGVRIPMDGSMTTECKYRIKQADKMAKDLYRAPFTPKDAQVIYQARYKAAIRYAFPVTLFNSEQLHQIQKKFIFYYLPKIGVNRHTPRSVVYGPVSMGGMGVMDLRLEQPIYAYNTMLGHMRRDDNAGRSINATLYITQAEVGIATEFYNTELAKYPYVTKNTRWHYVWKMCNEFGITMHINDMWIPTPLTENDQNLMEVAVKDPYFTTRKKWKLEVINNCRQYIGVFFISEMTKEDGKVDRRYLDGDARVESNVTMFKHARKPPKLAWGEWKAFIFRNFLINGYQVTPTIGGNKRAMSKEVICEMSIIREIHSPMTMQEIYDRLPRNLKSILQFTHFPKDNGEHLCNSLMKNDVIGASDGSVKVDRNGRLGGFSFSLQDYHCDDNCMIGCASLPRSNDATSLTAELYGILGTVTLVLILWKANEGRISQFETRSITIFSDNKEAIKKCNEETQRLNVSQHLRPEYDLEKIIWDIQTILPIAIHHKWVKGHQNEMKDGTQIYGPFPRDVQLNIEMDELANRGNNLPLQQRQSFSHTKISIYDDDGVMITDFSKFLYKKINGKSLQQYIEEKYGLEPEVVQLIDWYTIGEVLKTYTPFRQKKTVQMIYDWQNDGSQKQKILHGEGQCPACGEEESHLHYVTCTDKAMTIERQKQLKIFSNTLLKHHTCPAIIAVLQKLLQGKYDVVHRALLQPCHEYEIVILEAVSLQQQIGSDSVVKGLLATTWERAQQLWALQFGTSGKHHTQWLRTVIKSIHTYTHEMWSKRNLLLHGEDDSESLEIQKHKCKVRIRELYKKSRVNLSLEDKKLFHMPLPVRLKGTVPGMLLWIERVEMVFQQKDQDYNGNLITNYWVYKKDKAWRHKSPDVT